MKVFLKLLNSFLLFALIICMLSCKKPVEDLSPVIDIIAPQEYMQFDALDTIRVKAIIKDDQAKSLNISVYLKSNTQTTASDVWMGTFQGNEIALDMRLPLTNRWLPGGEYFLTISANDGNQTTWSSKTIIIRAIPKRLAGLIVGIENLQLCDVYVSDTSFIFEKKYTLQYAEDGVYDYMNSRFISIHSNGVARFYHYPEWTLQKEITNLKKAGTPFRFDKTMMYPYFYITNANGFIYAIDKDANIRQSINTLFSPFKINWANDKWFVLSEYYPEPQTWIEIPSMLKNYSFNGKLVDAFHLSGSSWLVIEQKSNGVALHKYTSDNNFISKENEIGQVLYNGGIKIQNKIYLALSQKLYEVNPIYFTLFEVQNSNDWHQLKYEETGMFLMAISNNQLFFINSSNFQVVKTLQLPGKIMFYDFLYE